jgi:hypothetical protein
VDSKQNGKSKQILSQQKFLRNIGQLLRDTMIFGKSIFRVSPKSILSSEVSLAKTLALPTKQASPDLPAPVLVCLQ